MQCQVCCTSVSFSHVCPSSPFMLHERCIQLIFQNGTALWLHHVLQGWEEMCAFQWKSDGLFNGRTTSWWKIWLFSLSLCSSLILALPIHTPLCLCVALRLSPLPSPLSCFCGLAPHHSNVLCQWVPLYFWYKLPGIICISPASPADVMPSVSVLHDLMLIRDQFF